MTHHFFRGALVTAVLCGSVASASAQQPLQLQISNGHVTLHAQNVPVRQILAEWARLGGTTIINGDRVTAPPVTLDLQNVPERQALDIILRGVSGYVLGARPELLPGFSAIDRIIILVSSNVTRPAPTPSFTNGPATRIPQPQVETNDPEENPVVDVPPPAPRGVPRPFIRRPPTPLPQPLPADEPSVTAPDGVDTPQQEEPQGAVAPTANNPFGVPAGTSATPGVITPVPQPRRPPRIQDPD
jgi:hypothetical protein